MARRRERWFYLLISPWLVGFVVFQGGPVVAALLLAFADWPLPQAPRWVGLRHFGTLLTDPLFARSLVNTAYYALGAVPLSLGLGLGLALLLHRERPGVRVFRAIFFLPSVLSGVALTLLWGWVFNPRYGLANTLLGSLGIQGPDWLQSEAWAMPTLILMSLWGVGISMVVYLAALSGLPRDLYEAARLDGAGPARRFRHITWPLLAPATFFLAVVNLIGTFQLFTPTYLLTQGGPNHATLTLPLYLYQNAFSYGRLGYASALASVLFLAIVLLTLIQFRVLGRRVFYLGEG